MRNVKKIMLTLVAMLSLVLAMQFSVSAAPAKIAKSDFNLYADGGKLKVTYTGARNIYNGLQIELKNISSGRTTIYNTKSTINTFSIAKKVAYRVRIRGYWDDDYSGKVKGPWSSARYDVDCPFKISLGKNTTFNLTLYKAKGVKSYTVYISKKEKNGYKKVGTYAVNGSSRTINIKKCGSSKIKRYTNYYIKAYANVKASGDTVRADTYQSWGGYIYTSYR